MRVVFCLPGFDKDVIRLQPWVTVYEVSQRFVKMGHAVDIITDRPGNGRISSIAIHTVKTLRGHNSDEMEALLESIRPDIIIVSVTPLSLVSSRWYSSAGRYRVFAYISYPFYTALETLKAFPYLTRADRLSYGRQLLVPGSLWGHRLKAFFEGIICQSERTKTRLTCLTGGSTRIHAIPPGIDSDWISMRSGAEKRETRFLYVGSPLAIRGFFFTLEALRKVTEKGVRLKILARGADPCAVRNIKTLADSMGLGKIVSVQGGWLGKKELQSEMTDASVILMPFALVPSELPVSVLEAICCETPLIVSDIDGLPEAVGECGIAVRQCSVDELARAMARICSENGLDKKLREACRKRKSSIKTWEEVSAQWASTFGM